MNLWGDSDAALALEADGVHGAFVGDIGAALAEKAVHEGGLAVVDMRYHRHVAEPARVECADWGYGGGWGGGGGGGGRRGEGA